MYCNKLNQKTGGYQCFDLFLLSLSLCIVYTCYAAGNENVLFDFSGATAEANHVTIMGAGFGSYPQPDITFGAIPTNNAFDGATDGKGIIVQADPGEGLLVLTQTLPITRCALIRCSVRTSASHASVYLASLDGGENTYISTITANVSAQYVNQYKRIADFFLPPSTGFQGIIQILNTSATEKLTAYIDNLEILVMGEDKIDLAISEITGEKSTVVKTPTPVLPTPTPTVTPIPEPQAGDTITIPLKYLAEGAKPLEMVYIPAGTFTMGSPDDEVGREYDDNDESPQHQVTISKPFYMSKYEVTEAQWLALMEKSEAVNCSGPSEYPLKVIRSKCLPFFQTLNEIGIGTFRFPTEAEWEYACRAGNKTRFFWGSGSNANIVDQYAWYNDNSGSFQETGLKLPNPWGLYDITGNMWEWCSDIYGEYSSDAQTDPTGPNEGTYFVIRGGNIVSFSSNLRSANRQHSWPDDYYGLRLVLVPNN